MCVYDNESARRIACELERRKVIELIESGCKRKQTSDLSQFANKFGD